MYSKEIQIYIYIYTHTDVMYIYIIYIYTDVMYIYIDIDRYFLLLFSRRVVSGSLVTPWTIAR